MGKADGTTASARTLPGGRHEARSPTDRRDRPAAPRDLRRPALRRTRSTAARTCRRASRSVVRPGSALLQAAWLGEVFGLELAGEDWEGDWCPTYPHHPKLPPGVGPIGPDPDPNPVYLTGYYLGLSSVLADGVERGVTSPVVGAVLEASVGNLERSVSR